MRRVFVYMDERQNDQSKKLTKKQQKFLEAFLQTWNATEAARQAKYASPHVSGSKLLATASVRAALQRRLDEAAMAANEVLARLTQQARANLAEFLRFTPPSVPGGVMREPVIDWSAVQEKGYLVKKLSFTKYGPVLELHDAQSALAMLGKAHGLFVERTENVNTEAQVVLYMPDNQRDETNGQG